MEIFSKGEGIIQAQTITSKNRLETGEEVGWEKIAKKMKGYLPRRWRLLLTLSKFDKKRMIAQNHRLKKVTKKIHLSGTNQEKISLVVGADTAVSQTSHDNVRENCGKAQCGLTPCIPASSLHEKHKLNNIGDGWHKNSI